MSFQCYWQVIQKNQRLQIEDFSIYLILDRLWIIIKIYAFTLYDCVSSLTCTSKYLIMYK